MTENYPADSPLGKESEYRSTYSPELLYAIPRVQGRSLLGIGETLPFKGADLWTAYELSWLDEKGKPQVAIADFSVPCDSPNIIESKSLKLYLNSFNQSQYQNIQLVKDLIKSDLSKVAGAPVSVMLHSAASETEAGFNYTEGYCCVDEQDISITMYQPDRTLLTIADGPPVVEKLVSHLLKSNCPVTGQPDWASLFIDYYGSPIDKPGLLRYLVSYREHSGFHEQCVEQIFMDILAQCGPQRLTLNARYLRRGGLDINPVRSTEECYEIVGRQLRQ